MSTKLCPFCAEEIQAEAVKCKHCGSWLDQPPPMPHVAGPAGSQRLTRSSTDRMLAGVCGGMAKQMGLDPTLIRVTVALVSIFTALVPGLIAYVVLALVIPSDDEVPTT
jgi:phage shock protein C